MKASVDVPLRPALAAVVSALAVAVVSAALPPVLLEPLTGWQLFRRATGGIRTSVPRHLIRARRSWSRGLGRRAQLHPGPPPYGIPHVVVAGDQRVSRSP